MGDSVPYYHQDPNMCSIQERDLFLMILKRYLSGAASNRKKLQQKTSTIRHSYDEVNRMLQSITIKKRK